MHDIRNSDGHLVCRINDDANIIEILTRGIVTTIILNPGGKTQITHTRKQLLTA